MLICENLGKTKNEKVIFLGVPKTFLYYRETGTHEPSDIENLSRSSSSATKSRGLARWLQT